VRTGRNISVRHIIHALLHGPNIACFFILHNLRVNLTNLTVLCLLYARCSVILSEPPRTSQWTETLSNITVSSPKTRTSQRTQRSSNGCHGSQGVTHSTIHPATHPSICLPVCLFFRLSVYLPGDKCGSQDNRGSEQPVIQLSTVTYRSSPWAPVRICLRCPVRTHSTMLTRLAHSMTTPAGAPSISPEYSKQPAHPLKRLGPASSAFRSSYAAVIYVVVVPWRR
jgi:hypothetical protein